MFVFYDEMKCCVDHNHFMIKLLLTKHFMMKCFLTKHFNKHFIAKQFKSYSNSNLILISNLNLNRL